MEESTSNVELFNKKKKTVEDENDDMSNLFSATSKQISEWSHGKPDSVIDHVN